MAGALVVVGKADAGGPDRVLSPIDRDHLRAGPGGSELGTRNSLGGLGARDSLGGLGARDSPAAGAVRGKGSVRTGS